MKIAVIGAGISGIYAAYQLSDRHDVTLYEANGYLGGHTDTHHVDMDDRVCTVDTGFIVFNEDNYPLFTKFLEELGVDSQLSNMSFSVTNRSTGFEYNAGTLSGLFGNRRNLFRPGFYRMLLDIIRFYRRSPALLETTDDDLTIGQYLEAGGYGSQFTEDHLVPMASALWSSPPSTVRQFPARYFVAFMYNHSMLQVTRRPVWRTVAGGSSQYVKAFQQRFQGQILVNSPVHEVTRTKVGVKITTGTDMRHYDAVVIACHSDQAGSILCDANDRERSLLSAIRYQENEIILHTDTSVMPAAPRLWASWNVLKPRSCESEFIVTYNMNMLQQINSPVPLLVSLNAGKHIDRNKVFLRRQYHHPVYTPESLRAQRDLRESNGQRNTYFVGAYLGWGFHEDGVRSAQRVVDAFEQTGLSRAA